MSNLSHIDEGGNSAMVDITDKQKTIRIAKATCRVLLNSSTLDAITDSKIKKGDVLSIAQLAGIMGAKKTADLIPLCHPLTLTSSQVELRMLKEASAIEIVSTCKTSERTGVEMEAMTAVTVAALTLYDMCKSIDRSISITNIRLLHKSGGKSGIYNAV